MSQIFIDTSIQISRDFHGKECQDRINKRLSNYNLTVTSLIVKQEYKRRVLKEALYLLNNLNRLNSYASLRRHVENNLPPLSGRKRTICLQLLSTIFESDTDNDLTERARRYLRTLLKFGMMRFENAVDSIVRESGCACASVRVVEEKPYQKYDLGGSRCSEMGQACGIVLFLRKNKKELECVKEYLSSIPPEHLTEELVDCIDFISKVTDDPDTAMQLDPCKTAGDLLIALESKGIENFYTLNWKESRHLCRVLNQNLIIGQTNQDRDEQVCRKEDSKWEIE